MFKIMAVVFIGILAGIGFFNAESLYTCGAFARHRCSSGLQPKEGGDLLMAYKPLVPHAGQAKQIIEVSTRLSSGPKDEQVDRSPAVRPQQSR
jgi:hypothetical protein